ncbi:hypothetical protein CAPTEDRAFT_180186 [Capitella teleta]|uniref:Thioredoxin-like fold domain-containing protein n=1 Tax=Capitella teleta TaxID=283909 RepID=N1PBA8_CAPTE|nr:hypothetical protein CAPTEDRAFT_180186 [Capitella teleta]|eukprot:ELU18880.1 hypothetical protein CAPTEDRAFT_180186 [Capitella teleta]
MLEKRKRTLSAVKEDKKQEEDDKRTGEEPTQEELHVEELKKQIYLTKKREKINGRNVITDLDVVCFYFSAGWCPPCREFTPTLAGIHREATRQGAPIRVIYVPFDKSEECLWQYVDSQHGDWLIVPLEDPLIANLVERYGVGSVPKLIVISGKGEVITKKGRKEIQDKGIVACRNWATVAARVPPAVNE